MRIAGFVAFSFFFLALSVFWISQPRLAHAAKLTYDDQCKAAHGALKWDGNGLCWRCTKRNPVTLKTYTLWCKD